ncbi:MAG: hypothetical protein KZQ93_17290 [Candidatus Thiodiazotropha sp. (ex Monitilora ramsayi)]|nr:hypothetical protein [Candidatus Thiodiazotropha sp. (ex Monitilora ramsayi)]
MIELNQLTVLVAAEVLVGLLILSGVLVLFALLRKGRNRKAAHHLAERVQSDKPQRTERLKKLLVEKYGYEGSELEQILHNITQNEMRLYQNIINGFLKDDQVFLQQVDVDVENLVLSYQTLNLPEATSAGAAQDRDESELDEEIQHLREENERLSDELKVTMDTMGRMLNEYSTMFAGGAAETFEKAPVAEAPASAPIEDESDAAEAIEVSAEEPDDVSVESDGLSEPAPDDMQQQEDGIEIDIPDFQAGDGLMESSDLSEQVSKDMEEASSAAMEEEVSEIIDEVMDIADEITTQDEDETAADESATQTETVESLMDEVQQVDIEIPDMESVPVESQESEAASLEEEWAKLLEEDAASEEEKKDQ